MILNNTAIVLIVWSQTLPFPSNNISTQREGEKDGGGGKVWANVLPFGVTQEFLACG